jgi:hypothetical protein
MRYTEGPRESHLKKRGGEERGWNRFRNDGRIGWKTRKWGGYKVCVDRRGPDIKLLMIGVG